MGTYCCGRSFAYELERGTGGIFVPLSDRPSAIGPALTVWSLHVLRP